MLKVSVLMPAFNEEKRIASTIAAVKNVKEVSEIIVIDDSSSDNTYNIALNSGVTVYRLQKNSGKGEALNFGMNKATGDLIIFLDSDVCETGSEVSKLIKPLLNNECDVTIAKFPPAKKKGGFGFVKKLSKNGVKFLTGKEIFSVLSGQRGFKREVLRNIGKFSSGYGVEVGMTIDILRLGYRIKEVEVLMTHAETGRDLNGFIHRGKQFNQILKVLLYKTFFRKVS